MTECALCSLPTPEPPVTDGDVDGAFCCPGCLEVRRQLGPVENREGKRTGAVSDDAEDRIPKIPDHAETAFLRVDGLHCAACETFLEAAATRTEGVLDARVSYVTDAARLTYDPGRIQRHALPDAITTLGYSARFPDEGDGAEDGRMPGRTRLLVGSVLGMLVMLGYGLVLYPAHLDLSPTHALALLVVVVALGMLYCAATFWLLLGVPGLVALSVGMQAVIFLVVLYLPEATAAALAVPATAALAAVVVVYTGFPFLRGAYVSLRSGRPNMDLLVALAVVAAYAYSIAVALAGGVEVYFDVAVMVVLVVSLGNAIETRLKRRAVEGLSGYAVDRAVEARRRRDDGTTETVSVDDVEPGDRLVVRAGERVPVDGQVIEGTAGVDESRQTGEAIPDAKRPGDAVIGGTVVLDDVLVVEAGPDGGSTADRLATLLWDARSRRSGIQQFADRLAAAFVPLVVLLALLTAGWYLASGAGLGAAVLTGVAVLVVSCPCALGLATPLAVAAGVAAAWDRGVVVTDVSLFERVRGIDVFVLDKTGTLTTGEMTVADVTALDGVGSEALRLAAAAERLATHPVAEAIAAAVDGPSPPVADFERDPRGVRATVDGRAVEVGHPARFRTGDWRFPAALEGAVEEARAVGRVPALVGWDGTVRAVIAVEDRPREGWAAAVEGLASPGREIVVLTGDDAAAAGRFRAHPAVDRVFAGVPPEGKAEAVRRLRHRGRVAMIGDGSNDAPAMAVADLGIALAPGTALATDAADAVVAGGDLAAVPGLLDVAGGTRARIRGNLGWALTYNAVAIPLAVAGLLNPLFAAVAMAGSSLVVVANSARPLGRWTNDPDAGLARGG